MQKIIFLLFLGIAIAGCRKTSGKKTETKTESKTAIEYFYLKDSLPRLRNPEVLDSFTDWRNLYRLMSLPKKISEEALRDKVQMVHSTLVQIQKKPYPPKLDTVDIRSRMLRFRNETLQLRWILKEKLMYPSRDSLYNRFTDAYTGLIRQINMITEDKENYEEIFLEKRRRDSILQQRFQ